MPDPKKKKGVLDSITEGGLTPLGREAKDSLQKQGVMSAIRTVGRGYAKEFTDSFKSPPGGGKKIVLVPKKVGGDLPKPNLSAVAGAVDKIGRKTRATLGKK